jgi:hypothetical protein
MTAWADHGQAGNGEPLAIVLRAGNAGSNTAADHIEAAGLALAQLPRHLRRKVLVRADSGGGGMPGRTWGPAGHCPRASCELLCGRLRMLRPPGAF